MSVFGVLEEHKERIGMIFAQNDGNAFIKENGYVCDINLGHVAHYYSHAEGENRYGASIDAKCAFWQVRIPPQYRCYHRVLGPDGRLYQACVASMGHAVMCELMQKILLVTVGTPGYTREYSQLVPQARTSVWVDGVFVTASTKALAERALAHVERNCQAVSLSLKDSHHEAVQEIDFIGIHWNLKNGTIRVADKTYFKLPEIIPASMTAAELEQLIDRK